MKMTLSEVFDVLSKDSGSVGTGASVGKTLDHIALLRAIKKKQKKKQKNFSPTDGPCLEKGIYGQANYFFLLALEEKLGMSMSVEMWNKTNFADI